MDLENITKIIEVFEKSKVSDLELESEDFKIKLSKKVEEVKYELPVKKEVVGELPVQEEVNHFTVIKSPIVGTFYSSPSPDSDAFVSVGKEVKVGDILCIIEAMKVLNEIKSEVNGVVKEVLISDGNMVQYDEPIFYIEEIK